mmetsp:Transcript_25797/g.55884  ORF Transcript_25797/g.55884 Transcript_25797/m.55884 type:complete len:290 (-) Transcript_25797:543-1412(-)
MVFVHFITHLHVHRGSAGEDGRRFGELRFPDRTVQLRRWGDFATEKGNVLSDGGGASMGVDPPAREDRDNKEGDEDESGDFDETESLRFIGRCVGLRVVGVGDTECCVEGEVGDVAPCKTPPHVGTPTDHHRPAIQLLIKSEDAHGGVGVVLGLERELQPRRRIERDAAGSEVLDCLQHCALFARSVDVGEGYGRWQQRLVHVGHLDEGVAGGGSGINAECDRGERCLGDPSSPRRLVDSGKTGREIAWVVFEVQGPTHSVRRHRDGQRGDQCVAGFAEEAEVAYASVA